MKNITVAIILIFALCMFVGCDSQDFANQGTNDSQGDNSSQTPLAKVDGYIMTATVKSVGDRVEVDVISAEYASGIFHIIVGENTQIYSAEGREITKQDIKAGDTVEITYNGQIMLSYPPQVVALKIVIK
jgi:hypothetical protein